MHGKPEAVKWTEERDGYTHSASGMRVVPCGPSSYAVLKGGRQVRYPAGRLRRWRNLAVARAFVEAMSAEASG